MEMTAKRLIMKQRGKSLQASSTRAKSIGATFRSTLDERDRKIGHGGGLVAEYSSRTALNTETYPHEFIQCPVNCHIL